MKWLGSDLADIAEVKDLYAEQRSVSKQDGRQVLTFGFERAKGASDVTVYDAAVEELRKLEKENPKVKFTELFSDIEYTKGQYHSAINAMVEGAILAVLVVFLFLRDWRATFIAALAILPAERHVDETFEEIRINRPSLWRRG
mgnify:CR=1 FL=1